MCLPIYVRYFSLIRQVWHFHGGPLDGLDLEISLAIHTPTELVFREDEIAPGWDSVYRRRPIVARVVEDEPMEWLYDYTGDTEGRRNELWYRRQFKWRNEEILRLKARLERQAKWIAKLRGTVKAMKSRARKRATSRAPALAEDRPATPVSPSRRGTNQKPPRKSRAP